jgi:hypothetical protein
MVNPTTAAIASSPGAQAILLAARERRPCLEHRFADDAYDRDKLPDIAVYWDFVLQLVRPTDKHTGLRY